MGSQSHACASAHVCVQVSGHDAHWRQEGVRVNCWVGLVPELTLLGIHGVHRGLRGMCVCVCEGWTCS